MKDTRVSVPVLLVWDESKAIQKFGQSVSEVRLAGRATRKISKGKVYIMLKDEDGEDSNYEVKKVFTRVEKDQGSTDDFVTASGEAWAKGSEEGKAATEVGELRGIRKALEAEVQQARKRQKLSDVKKLIDEHQAASRRAGQ